jgi:hypothetical protein
MLQDLALGGANQCAVTQQNLTGNHDRICATARTENQVLDRIDDGGPIRCRASKQGDVGKVPDLDRAEFADTSERCRRPRRCHLK